MSYKIKKNHTLNEYKEKYGESGLQVYSKEEVLKDESLLNGKTWWLIEDNYYEAKESLCAVLALWNNIGKIGKIIIGTSTILVIALIIACPILLKSCNADKPDDTDNQGKVGKDIVENVGTVYLTYYADSLVEYTNEIQSIKTNETQWTVQFSLTDNVYDWHIGFFVIDGENWTEIAKSTTHDESEITSYQEVVTLNQGIDLSDYKDKTITVALYCFMC